MGQDEIKRNDRREGIGETANILQAQARANAKDIASYVGLCF